MKTLVQIGSIASAVALALVAGAFLGTRSAAVPSMAPMIPEELCFEIEQSGGPNLSMRVGTHDLGNGHIVISGRLTDPGSSAPPIPVIGSLEIVPGPIRLYMTVTLAQSSEAFGVGGAFTATATLARDSSMEGVRAIGTIESFGVEYEPGIDDCRTDCSPPSKKERILLRDCP